MRSVNWNQRIQSLDSSECGWECQKNIRMHLTFGKLILTSATRVRAVGVESAEQGKKKNGLSSVYGQNILPDTYKIQ